MTLGENLRRLRNTKGLSQDEVAQTLFLSRQSVSKWENDGAEPGVENLKALSRLYGVTIDELVNNTQETKQGKGQVKPHEMFQLAVVARVLTALYGIAFVDEGLLLYCWDVPLLLAGYRFRDRFLWGTTLTVGGTILFVHLIITVKYMWYYDDYRWEVPFQWMFVTAGIVLMLVLLLQKKTRAYFTRED